MSIYGVPSGAEPVAAWIPSLDTAGLNTTTLTDPVGSNHGTLINMDEDSDGDTDENWVLSGGKYALDFDGTNDYVLGPVLSSDLQSVLNSNVFSVSIWVYVRSFANSPVVWSVQSAGSNDSGLIMFGSSGSTLYVKTANNALGLSWARTYTVSPAVAINTWTHVAFIKSGTGDNGSLYINETLQSSYTGSLATCVVGATHRLRVGAYASGVVPINGLVDDNRLFGSAIAGGDVSYLYNSGNGRGRIQSTSRRRKVSQQSIGAI